MPQAATRECRARLAWIARGVTPNRNNSQFSGYQTPV
jgi:hypothetical protein